MARLLGLELPPSIGYSVGRDVRFPNALYHWVVYVLMAIFIAFLIPIVVAFEAYQTVSVYSPDYNTTASHWFNWVWPEPEPGTQCEPHVFSIGDTFVTNIGSFVWSLAAANSAVNSTALKSKEGSLNASTIITMGQYTATSLDYCDANWLQVSADINAWKVEMSAMIACVNSDFILANTKVSAGFLDDETFSRFAAALNMPNAWVQNLVANAGTDLLYQMYHIASANPQAPKQLAVQAFPVQCPKAIVDDPQGFAKTVSSNLFNQSTWCSPSDSTNTPNIEIDWAAKMELPSNIVANDTSYGNAVNNVMQAFLAAVRFDLGNRQPNNVIVNTPEIIAAGQTFLDPFVGTNFTTSNSGLFIYTNTTENLIDTVQYPLPSIPLFLATYLCHLIEPKNVGSAAISVLVSILTISGTAWGILVFAVVWWYKKGAGDSANYCEGHLGRGPPTRVDYRSDWSYNSVPLAEKV